MALAHASASLAAPGPSHWVRKRPNVVLGAAVCQAGALRQHRGAVLCAGCGLRLDLAGEGLGLDHVRAALADALAGHALSGCPAPPAFGVEERFGTATLFMRCGACGALHAVV